MRLVVPLLCLILTSSCRGAEAPTTSSGPEWVVLRVDTVKVAAHRPGTSTPWDSALPQQDDGAECGLLGLAGSIFINPIAGKGAEYLCNIGARPKARENDPSAPDLVVTLGAGASTNYPTYTARDSLYHVFRSEFVVPTAAIGPDGLLLMVRDRDGNESETIGTVRLQRDQLVQTLQNNPVLTLSDSAGGLERLELVVLPHSSPSESTTVVMNAQDGTVDSKFRPIRAGEVVEVSATGKYKIGSFLNKWIDTRGYPDGTARSYNFETEPFKYAPHGSAVAIIGNGDAKTGQVVGTCARFVSRGSGPLVVGINDSEPKNNEGSAQFTVQVTLPSAEEWLGTKTSACQR